MATLLLFVALSFFGFSCTDTTKQEFFAFDGIEPTGENYQCFVHNTFGNRETAVDSSSVNHLNVGINKYGIDVTSGYVAPETPREVLHRFGKVAYGSATELKNKLIDISNSTCYKMLTNRIPINWQYGSDIDINLIFNVSGSNLAKTNLTVLFNGTNVLENGTATVLNKEILSAVNVTYEACENKTWFILTKTLEPTVAPSESDTTAFIVITGAPRGVKVEPQINYEVENCTGFCGIVGCEGECLSLADNGGNKTTKFTVSYSNGTCSFTTDIEEYKYNCSDDYSMGLVESVILNSNKFEYQNISIPSECIAEYTTEIWTVGLHGLYLGESGDLSNATLPNVVILNETTVFIEFVNSTSVVLGVNMTEGAFDIESRYNMTTENGTVSVRLGQIRLDELGTITVNNKSGFCGSFSKTNLNRKAIVYDGWKNLSQYETIFKDSKCTSDDIDDMLKGFFFIGFSNDTLFDSIINAKFVRKGYNPFLDPSVLHTMYGESTLHRYISRRGINDYASLLMDRCGKKPDGHYSHENITHEIVDQDDDAMMCIFAGLDTCRLYRTHAKNKTVAPVPNNMITMQLGGPLGGEFGGSELFNELIANTTTDLLKLAERILNDTVDMDNITFDDITNFMDEMLNYTIEIVNDILADSKLDELDIKIIEEVEAAVSAMVLDDSTTTSRHTRGVGDKKPNDKKYTKITAGDISKPTNLVKTAGFFDDSNIPDGHPIGGGASSSGSVGASSSGSVGASSSGSVSSSIGTLARVTTRTPFPPPTPSIARLAAIRSRARTSSVPQVPPRTSDMFRIAEEHSLNDRPVSVYGNHVPPGVGQSVTEKKSWFDNFKSKITSFRQDKTQHYKKLTKPRRRANVVAAIDTDGDGMAGYGQIGDMNQGPRMSVRSAANRPGQPKNPRVSGGMNGVFMMTNLMSASEMMSRSTQNMMDGIIGNRYAGMPKEQAITLVALDMVQTNGNILTQVGGMMAAVSGGMTGGGMAMAGVGIAMSACVQIAVMGIQIHQILNPPPPVPDPVLVKYNEYAAAVTSVEAGNRWCLLPENDLYVTLSFDRESKHTEGSKINPNLTLAWGSALDTKILVRWHPMLIMNAQLTVKCAGGGRLRFEEVNSKNLVMEKSVDYETGSTVFSVVGLPYLIADYPTLHGACGSMIDMTITSDKYDLSELYLVDRAGPGEPENTAKMPSDVCDKFPWKKFYVYCPGCEYNRGGTGMAYSTCTMMFRKSVWSSERRAWTTVNPFGPNNIDRKVFTFQRSDFRQSFPLEPNHNPAHKTLCSGADQSDFCRWPDVMVLSDTSACNNKVRWFKLVIADSTKLGSTAIAGLFLSCPRHSRPMYTIKKGSSDNVGVNSVGFYSEAAKFTLTMTQEVSEPILWVFCQDILRPEFKSDIIELTITEDVNVTRFNHSGWAGFWENTKTGYLSDPNIARHAMYNISIRGPVGTENDNIAEIPSSMGTINVENRDPVKDTPTVENPVVRLSPYVTKVTTETVNDTDLYGPFSASFDVTHIQDAFDKNTDHFWKIMQKGCKTFSSISINFGLCYQTTSELEFEPLGDFVWSWLDKRVKDTPTQRIPGDVLKFRNTQMYNGTSNTMENCDVELNVERRQVKLGCRKEGVLRRSMFSGEHDKKICMLLSTANDQCPDEKLACYNNDPDWTPTDTSMRKAWSENEGYNPLHYFYGGLSYQNLKNTFCRAGYITYSDYSMINKTYQSLTYVDVERQDPVRFDYGGLDQFSAADVVIKKEDYLLVDKLTTQLKELYDVANDPTVSAINEFTTGLTDAARDITRVEVPVYDVTNLKKIRDGKIQHIQDTITETIIKLIGRAAVGTPWAIKLIEHASKKCCVLRYNYSSEQLAVENIDPSYKDFNCPKVNYFYRSGNETTRPQELLGPDYEYLSVKQIKAKLGSVGTTEAEWTVCLNPREIEFEDESALDDFKEEITAETKADILPGMVDEIVNRLLDIMEDQQTKNVEDEITKIISQYEFHEWLLVFVGWSVFVFVCLLLFVITCSCCRSVHGYRGMTRTVWLHNCVRVLKLLTKGTFIYLVYGARAYATYSGDLRKNMKDDIMFVAGKINHRGSRNIKHKTPIYIPKFGRTVNRNKKLFTEYIDERSSLPRDRSVYIAVDAEDVTLEGVEMSIQVPLRDGESDC